MQRGKVSNSETSPIGRGLLSLYTQSILSAVIDDRQSLTTTFHFQFLFIKALFNSSSYPCLMIFSLNLILK